MNRCFLIASAMVFVSSSAHAAMIGVVGEFAGDAHEGFESGPAIVSTQPLSAFDGVATIRDGVTQNAPTVISGWDVGWMGTTSSASPHSGDYFAGSLNAGTSYEFDVDIDRFGGWFAGNQVVGGGEATFYGADGSVIGQAAINMQSPGVNEASQWFWNGWEFDSAVRRVVVASDYANGAYIMQDDIQIGVRSPVVPSPGSTLVFAASVVGAVRSRRRDHSPGM